MYRRDTIVACATPPGRGGVSIVRLSGDDALAISRRLFAPKRRGCPEPWRLVYGTVHEADDPQAPIDEALAVWMPGPRSYSGEDVVELHVHGSPLVVERLIGAAIRCGARPAEPGEFTRRAVLNGRIDLLQAEAIADLIDARVEAGAAAAWRQLQGALSERLAGIRQQVLSVLADVEANVDFSDDDLPDEAVDVRTRDLQAAVAEIDELLTGFPAARRLREGYSVTFVGRPNVGKSSLINALLGTGRMIVSREPGTTRDSVEETVDLGGMAFVLTDTAGIRATASEAEREAIARARQKAMESDIVVLVLDRSEPLTPEDRELLEQMAAQRAVVVLNKADLPPALRREDLALLERRAGSRRLELSARTGEGLPGLVARLREMVAEEADRAARTPGISRVRHRMALERTRERIREAISILERYGEQAPELVAVELRGALVELSSLTEPLDNEEILDQVFSKFCIGK